MNNAIITSAENIICDKCSERLMFHAKDNTKVFSIGLFTMIECMMCAVKDGLLPAVPYSWLKHIDDIYNTKFAFDEELCY